MDVFEELKRIITPFDVEQIDHALADRAVDVRRRRPLVLQPRRAAARRRPTASPFNGDALLAGMQAVCLLGTYLPAGDPRRLGVPKLHAKILARLANPELLLFGGSRALKIEGKPYVAPGYQSNPSQHGVDNGAIIVAHGYVYFRPGADRRRPTPTTSPASRDAAELHYPMQTFPWSGLYHVWQAALSPGVAALVARAVDTPIAAGGSELDPRLSAPAIVDAIAGAPQARSRRRDALPPAARAGRLRRRADPRAQRLDPDQAQEGRGRAGRRRPGARAQAPAGQPQVRARQPLGAAVPAAPGGRAPEAAAVRRADGERRARRAARPPAAAAPAARDVRRGLAERRRPLIRLPAAARRRRRGSARGVRCRASREPATPCRTARTGRRPCA